MMTQCEKCGRRCATVDYSKVRGMCIYCWADTVDGQAWLKGNHRLPGDFRIVVPGWFLAVAFVLGWLIGRVL